MYSNIYEEVIYFEVFYFTKNEKYEKIVHYTLRTIVLQKIVFYGR